MNAFIKQTSQGFEVHTAQASELFVTLRTHDDAEKVRLTLEGGTPVAKRKPGRQPGMKLAPVNIDGTVKNKGGRPKGSGKKKTLLAGSSNPGKVSKSLLAEAMRDEPTIIAA